MVDSLSWPSRHVTLGALLRRPYEQMSAWTYARLAQEGFEDMRPAFSAVVRHLPPQGARVSDLAVLAGMTKQSMGYLVDQMLACGYVRVVPHPTDRRANSVQFTERGEAAATRLVVLSGQYEAWLGEALGGKKMERLRSGLAELHTLLEGQAAPPSTGD